MVFDLSLLKGKNWVHHSDLITYRGYAPTITMAKGTFIFGGAFRPKSWEWLPSGSSTWVQGGSIPDPGIMRGCGVQISSTEILLFGGWYTMQRILKFNVETHEWIEMDEKLQPGRSLLSCILLKNDIILTGGADGLNTFKLTQILDKDSLTLKYSSDMKQARKGHGLVVAHYKNQPTLLAIGGAFWKKENRYQD